MPTWVKAELSRFSRCPSSGGFSFSMSWVSATAICVIAADVSATGPPSPMFSPAAVHSTPAAVSRAPSDGSAGHWCDSPQPAAISWLCRLELSSSPLLVVYAGRPAWARAWLMTARTLSAADDAEASDAEADGEGRTALVDEDGADEPGADEDGADDVGAGEVLVTPGVTGGDG